MADVFISYSKQAPHHTRDLANQLEARGFTVWWDTELLPGDKFHDRIRDEITAAKAVIVIWSPASVGSTWVQAEARMAAAQNKLLTVCTLDLEPDRVPLPFNMLHIEKVGEHDKLVSAFADRGLYPRDEAKARMAQRAEECVRLAKEYCYGAERPAAADIDQAIRLLEEAIQLGNQHAKVILGGIYAEADFGKARPAEALRLLYEAKAAGNIEASLSLAGMYVRGVGVPKDVQEGFRLFQEAADAGLAFANFRLGLSYQYGLDVPRDIELARRYLLKAAESGDTLCTYRLGVLFCEEGDFQRGTPYFEKASVLGFGLATISLADLMLEGRGTNKDVAKGRALLEDMAQCDAKGVRAQALTRLAHLYLSGVGVKENVPEAISKLSQAVDLDDATAMCNLGDLYDLDPRVPRDESKARALFERAVAKGSIEGKARLGRTHLRSNPAKGLALLREAEKAGSGHAAGLLALCYQHGVGVARSTSEARRWYKVAEARGENVAEALKGLATS